MCCAWCLDGAEVSLRQFGTSAELSQHFWKGPKCPYNHLGYTQDSNPTNSKPNPNPLTLIEPSTYLSALCALRTLRTLDISDPRQFGTSAEVSVLRPLPKMLRHFGTSAEVSQHFCRPLPKMLRHFGTSAEVSQHFWKGPTLRH